MMENTFPWDVSFLFLALPFSYADCMPIMAIMAAGELFFVSAKCNRKIRYI